MRTHYRYALAFLLFTACTWTSFAQTPFVKTLRGSTHLFSTARTFAAFAQPSGNYIVFTEHLEDGCIRLELDADGNELSRIHYANPAGPEGEHFTARETADGGHILAASGRVDFSSDASAWLIKLNSAGTIEWSNSYNGSMTTTEAFVAVQTQDGGYALAGSVDSYYYVVKTNSLGVIEWQIQPEHLAITDLYVAANGDLLYTGTNEPPTSAFVETGRLNPATGALIWNESISDISGPVFEQGNTLFEAPNGDIFVCGIADQGFFARYSSTGSDEMVRSIYFKEGVNDHSNGQINAAALLPNGNVLIGGKTRTHSTGTSRIFVAELDTNGVPVQSNLFDFATAKLTAAIDVNATNQAVLAASTVPTSTGLEEGALIAGHLDSLATICVDATHSLNAGGAMAGFVRTSNFGWVTVTAPVSVGTLSYAQTTGSFTAVTVCGGAPLAVTVDATPMPCGGGGTGSVQAVTTGGTPPYTYAWSANAGSATTEQVTNLFDGTYTVTVTDATAATAFASGTIIDPGSAVAQTQLTSTSCGVVLPQFNAYFFCNPVANAERYHFQFTNVSGFNESVFSHANTPTSTYCSMVFVPGAAYGTTYDVQVRAKVNGCWGNFGPTCQITTPGSIPTTQLAPAYANTTLASTGQYVHCVAVAGAQRYQYEVAAGGDTAIAYSYAASPTATWFTLNWVPNVLHSTTYSIRVKAKVGGNWGAYGPAANITTPSLPVPQLTSFWCNSTLNSLSNYVYCTQVLGSQRYQYEITDNGTFLANTFSYWAAPSSTWMSLALVPDIQYNTTYHVRVRAKVGGVWGNFGPSCDLTTPAAASKHSDLSYALSYPVAPAETECKVFPNPTAGGQQATVVVEGFKGNKATLSCYNVVGQLVLQEAVAVQDGRVVAPVPVAQNWPAGGYVIVIQNEFAVARARLQVMPH